jgi:hypothetical protein
MIEVKKMHKKDAPDANRVRLSATEQILHINSDFIVCNVIERLSGKRTTTVLRGGSIGSNCGSLRAFPSGSFANCLATAHTKSNA